MSTKQDQSAKEGAVAIQSTRDVNLHMHGLGLADVKELARIFFETYLPAFRAEAAAVARENAQAFMNEFVERLGKPNKATPEAFSKPDSQACFNTALNGSAEKGDQIDTGLLADAVLRRLESDSDPLLKRVCEESVRTLTKMGREHIAFLAFVQYAKHVTHLNFTDIGQLEVAAGMVLQVVEPGLNLSAPNKEYLESVGALSINPVANANLFVSSMQQNYPYFPKSLEDIQSTAPSLSRLIDAFEKSGAAMVFLTAVGKMIGALALEKALGKVDLAIWIH